MSEEQRRALLLRVARNCRRGLVQNSDKSLDRGVRESREWRESIELKSART
ncbi:hypothetical protein [Shewanella sp. SR44-3]|uniref:hypothetical protein n=1 Tax=Shewanella sp. SR44-3 TaxID=2760936 RepID=UPI0015FD4F0F|nr:hypothetical protein [Shewanella sp. SR44-3]MBB1269526.1 hypothetical protein [Shewanella sp. SR44-3]